MTMPSIPRRRALLALTTATALVVAAAVLGAVTGSNTGDARDAKGPTATAERRDLKTTVTLTGTIARADTTTIIYIQPAQPQIVCWS